MTPPTAPYRYEAQAWRAGLARVAGVDEAGRGPLAGPVVAAAVILTPDRRVKKLCDSKLLSPERREELFDAITARAIAIGVGIVDHVTIDRVNILQATRLAMLEALRGLAVAPDLIITDFVALPGLTCPQRNLVDGDARCATVAAASWPSTRALLLLARGRRRRGNPNRPPLLQARLLTGEGPQEIELRAPHLSGADDVDALDAG